MPTKPRRGREPAMPQRPCDLEAEHVLVATAMIQPDSIDELGAEGFDPADITTDWLRWTWWAIEEQRPDFRNGEVKALAVHRQLEAWHAEGRMALRDGGMNLRVPPVDAADRAVQPRPPRQRLLVCPPRAQKAVAARVIALGYDAVAQGRLARLRRRPRRRRPPGRP
jgi:replicative DNA helicase